MRSSAGGLSRASCLGGFESPLAVFPWFMAFFFISSPSSSGVVDGVRSDLLDLTLACEGGVRGRISLPVVAPGGSLLALGDG